MILSGHCMTKGDIAVRKEPIAVSQTGTGGITVIGIVVDMLTLARNASVGSQEGKRKPYILLGFRNYGKRLASIVFTCLNIRI
jgi:hypothetical protein